MRQSYKQLPGRRVFLSAMLMFIYQPVSDAFTLQQAEHHALRADPLVESYRAQARSYSESSVSEGTLPDPRLRLGAVNLPVDSFDLKQEQMTQMVVGIKQDFPRGDSRQYSQQQTELLSRSASAQEEDARRRVISEVRQTYLNLYYEIASIKIE